jgi:predicted AlkP superfamily phosphohydrolase/phosphomutase
VQDAARVSSPIFRSVLIAAVCRGSGKARSYARGDEVLGTRGRKVLILGLDSVSSDVLFKTMRGRLPNIGRLMSRGLHGTLRSTTPPLTIPAWLSMMTGQDPGRLGLYGFVHRRGSSYDDMWIPTTANIDPPTVWKVIGKHGKMSMVVGVPPSYPPKPINGISVGCFLTPGPDAEYTYPAEFKHEIGTVVGKYYTDVDFDASDKDRLLKDIYKMTEARFKLLEHMLVTKPWDMFMFVEIGLDRLHHAFWGHFDKAHWLYEPNNRYESAIPDYYRYLDGLIGRLLDRLDGDTVVIAVSDHGSKRMKGAFRINEWLRTQGYLVLRTEPERPTPIEQCDVDWSRTKAWAWGGHYARVFLNVRGREPEGVVDVKGAKALMKKLSKQLASIKDDHGKAMKNLVKRPEDLYKVVRGDAPDLMLFLDDLHWTADGSLGGSGLYLTGTGAGMEHGVHDWDGMFIL